MERQVTWAADIYKGYDITQSRGEWLVGINHPDGYRETGPFATKEAAMEWVDQQQLEQGLA